MPETYFRFGPFELSAAEHVLRRDGIVVTISPKTLAVLQVLLEAGGRVVSKADIIKAVWPDSFVGEANLPQTISILRKQLADAYPNESPVATLPRVGYFFSGAIEVSTGERTAVQTFATRTSSAPVAPELVVEASAVENPTPSLSAPPPRKFSSTRWIGSAVAVILLAAIAFLIVRSSSGPRGGSAPGLLTLKQYSHNEEENSIRAAAISPDGTLVAYADYDGINLRVINNGVIHGLPSPPASETSQLSWYPDGLHLLASTVSLATHRLQLWRLSVTAEAPVLLRTEAQQGIPSPDGEHIAFTSARGSEIWIAGSSGESPRLLLRGSANETFPVLLWSKDSQRLLLEKLAYISGTSGDISVDDQGQLQVSASYIAVQANTGVQTAQTKDLRFNTGCLLDDNKLLLSRLNQDTDSGASTFWTVDLDPRTNALASTPVETKSSHPGRVYALTCSRNGNAISAVVRRGSPDVYVGDLAGSNGKLENVRRLTYDSQADEPHGWTPDSTSVIFESDRSGTFQIYRQALNRHDPDIIAPTNTTEVFPQMSPDGRWILYENNGRPNPGEPYTLFRVPAAGGAPVEVSGGTVGQYRCPNFGKTCVMREREDSNIVFFALDPLTGKGPRLGSIPWMPGTWGAWDVSADGSMIAIPSQTPMKPEIVILSIGTGRGSSSPRVIPIKLDHEITALHWAVDGRGWFVATTATVGSRLFYVDLNGNATFLHATAGPTWADPSPDGRKLAFVEQTVDSNVWLSQ